MTVTAARAVRLDRYELWCRSRNSFSGPITLNRPSDFKATRVWSRACVP